MHDILQNLLNQFDLHSEQPPSDQQTWQQFLISLNAYISTSEAEKETCQTNEESESRYRLMAENTTDMISRHTATGDYIYASPASYSLLGYQPEELITRSPYEIIHPEDIRAVEDIHRDVLRTAGDYVITYRMRHKTGAYVWVETANRCVVDSEGNVEEIITISRNVTERIQFTHDLEVARQMAEKASEAKSVFLANVSHEFRTALNAVIGYTELVRGLAEDHQHEIYFNDLERIRNASDHLLKLINGLLDLSRIEAGKTELVLEKVPLKSIVENVAGAIYPLMAKNQNTFQVSMPEQKITLLVDQLKLRQILYNLLNNAARFTVEGKITLRIRQEKDDIIFEVLDTGPGIDPEKLPSIFNPYTRVNYAETRNREGTGLGLAISRQLCLFMGGDISVKSTLAQGSHFTVRLPMEVKA